jgi:hypothetical protein
MKVILTLLIVLLAVQTYAQQNIQRAELELKMEKSRHVKAGGAAIAALGGILVISGVLTMRQNFDLWDDDGDDNFKTGAVLLAFGIGGMGVGIPMTAVGARNQRKYKKQLEAISVGVNLTPHNKGLSLTYRF